MARISWAQVDSIPDILSAESFEFILGNIPIAGSTTDLTIKCQNVSQPGVSNEAWEAAMHGHVKRFRGRKVYPRQVTASFWEDSEFATLSKLRQWMEYVAGSESGNSQGYQADYSVTGLLITYDTTGAVINRTYFENMFPQDIPDVQQDGSSSQGMAVSVTFSYDRITADSHPVL